MTKPEIKEEETMVLRTVYLPIALDEELKKLALSKDISKGEFIRRSLKDFIERGVVPDAPEAAS